MALAHKIILHSPVSDEALLEGFVEQCLSDGVQFLAILGPGSQKLEDIIDELIVGNGDIPGRSFSTSAHLDEPLDDLRSMMQLWEAENDEPVQEVRL